MNLLNVVRQEKIPNKSAKADGYAVACLGR